MVRGYHNLSYILTMKKAVFVALVLILPLTGYTRRLRNRSRLHPERPIKYLGGQVGQKFKRPHPAPTVIRSTKKKIIVFSSLGGAGHTSLSRQDQAREL